MGELFTGALGSILMWVAGLIGLGVLILLLNVLALTGYHIRKGVELRKLLKKAKKEAEEKKYFVNDRWHTLHKKAWGFIGFPLLGWGLFYALVFLFVPIDMAGILLFLLLAPVCGYLGFLFTFDDDPASYL